MSDNVTASLNIRYLTNESKSVKVFTVTNSGVTPVSFEVFYNRGDIDKSIQHYIPPVATPCSPDIANMHGVLDILYPRWPNCRRLDYENRACLDDACQFKVDGKCEGANYVCT